jgi:hypothetical protein
MSRKDTPRCVDCKRPGTWTCEPCKALRRRIDAIHGENRPSTQYPPAVLLERERRVRQYHERALLGLPLFAEGAA